MAGFMLGAVGKTRGGICGYFKETCRFSWQKEKDILMVPSSILEKRSQSRYHEVGKGKGIH